MAADDRFLAALRDTLKAQGVDLDEICAADGSAAPAARVVVVRGDLRQTAGELAGTTRDQVVMVRVDEDTSRALDAWIKTGAIRSRSEAAALFIREGLRLHEAKFRELADAIRGVDDAKARLDARMGAIFGPSEAAAPAAGRGIERGKAARKAPKRGRR